MNNKNSILRWQEYSQNVDDAYEFLENIKIKLLESDRQKSFINKIISDLGINFTLAAKFGGGVTLFSPLVKSLIENGNIQIETSLENIALLTITTFSIIYLESKKEELEPWQLEELRKDSKTLLTELKLKGIGGGIVKKFIKVFDSISNIFNYIFKSLGVVSQGILDIISYTAILVPFMNGVNYIIGKYDLSLDNFIGNFLSLGVGITSLIAKHGLDYIRKKIEKNLGQNINIEPQPYIDGLNDTDLIKDSRKQM